MFARLHVVPTPDLSVEMLTALSAIMLAQGQESIWNKTEQGYLQTYFRDFNGVLIPCQPAVKRSTKLLESTLVSL